MDLATRDLLLIRSRDAIGKLSNDVTVAQQRIASLEDENNNLRQQFESREKELESSNESLKQQLQTSETSIKALTNQVTMLEKELESQRQATMTAILKASDTSKLLENESSRIQSLSRTLADTEALVLSKDKELAALHKNFSDLQVLKNASDSRLSELNSLAGDNANLTTLLSKEQVAGRTRDLRIVSLESELSTALSTIRDLEAAQNRERMHYNSNLREVVSLIAGRFGVFSTGSDAIGVPTINLTASSAESHKVVCDWLNSLPNAIEYFNKEAVRISSTAENLFRNLLTEVERLRSRLSIYDKVQQDAVGEALLLAHAKEEEIRELNSELAATLSMFHSREAENQQLLGDIESLSEELSSVKQLLLSQEELITKQAEESLSEAKQSMERGIEELQSAWLRRDAALRAKLSRTEQERDTLILDRDSIQRRCRSLQALLSSSFFASFSADSPSPDANTSPELLAALQDLSKSARSAVHGTRLITAELRELIADMAVTAQMLASVFNAQNSGRQHDAAQRTQQTAESLAEALAHVWSRVDAGFRALSTELALFKDMKGFLSASFSETEAASSGSGSLVDSNGSELQINSTNIPLNSKTINAQLKTRQLPSGMAEYARTHPKSPQNSAKNLKNTKSILTTGTTKLRSSINSADLADAKLRMQSRLEQMGVSSGAMGLVTELEFGY